MHINMSRYLTVATPRVTRTSVIYIERIIIYVEITLWTMGLARVFIRGHITVPALTAWSSGCRGLSYMGWNIVYLQVERKERKSSIATYMYMDVIYRIIWLHCVCMCVCLINNNIDTLFIKVKFYIIYYTFDFGKLFVYCFNINMTKDFDNILIWLFIIFQPTS